VTALEKVAQAIADLDAVRNRTGNPPLTVTALEGISVNLRDALETLCLKREGQ
jgi:hypothetical protein